MIFDLFVKGHIFQVSLCTKSITKRGVNHHKKVDF
jgi:hypothetical protein